MCIGVAVDRSRVYCRYEGNGKPDAERTLTTFKDHIKPKSHMIYDDENSHSLLISTLELKETVYTSSELKGLEDDENPMDRVNDIHSLLKIFLNSHDYRGLFLFIRL